MSLSELDKRVGAVEKKLDGNGQPGLIVRMDRAERTLAVYSKAAWIVLGAALVELVAIGIQAFHAGGAR